MKCLLYISYDSSEYINYYHLAIEQEFVMEYVPIESVGNIFKKVQDYGCDDWDWYIFSDEEASDWNFKGAFEDYDFKLSSRSEWTDSDICDFLSRSFGEDYFINDGSNKVEKLGKSIIKLFPYVNSVKELDTAIPEILKKVEENLEPEKMTELAHIILEKYGKG